jgi:hypothetical protein
MILGLDLDGRRIEHDRLRGGETSEHDGKRCKRKAAVETGKHRLSPRSRRHVA